MSFKLLPRLHFRGRFETDVCTANNDDIVTPIDPVTVAVRFGVNDIPSTDEAFISWMRGGTGRPRASWNYYGGNSCRFVDARIVSVDRGNGLLTAPGADQAIGGTVILGENAMSKTGVMVDLNPEGTWGTQIFADGMQVIAGGVTLRGRPTIAVSRWLGGRNTTVGGFGGAAATWQACIRKEELEPLTGASGALAELHVAAMAHRGVIIRYCTYLLSPGISIADLLSKFNRGESPPNPATGMLVGSIGIWEDGDYATMPNGRLLLQQRDLTWNHGDVEFGPATVSVDATRRKAVVDLITTVPEIDDLGTKLPAGEAALIVVPDQGGTPIHLGPLPYDQTTYETGGGLVEVDLTMEQVGATANGSFAVTFAGDIVLEEANLTVDTDDRNVYFDEGEKRTLTLRVLQRGRIPAAPVALRLVQRFNPEKKTSDPVLSNERALEHPDTVVTDGQGVAVIQARAMRAMLGFLHCFVDGEPDIPSATHGCIVNFRIFAADNYDHIPDDQLDFALIYEEVLRYYHVLYPAMTRIFSLANEQQVTQAAGAILERIDPSNWTNWSYMPRTREMSAGKRRLLSRWLDRVRA